MNKKIMIIGITVLFLAAGLIGWFYFFNTENPLIGTWEHKEFQPPVNITVEYSFFEDQKFLQMISYQVNQSWVNHIFMGEYKISGELLTMSYKNNLPAKTMNYSYELSDDTLRLLRQDEVPDQPPNFTRVSNVPLREWPIADKPITVPAESLVLNIGDLSEEYKICQNRSYEHGKIVDPIESYSVIYSKGNCSNYTEGLISIILKFDSSFDASIFYNETKFSVVLTESQKILNDSVNAIGDESFAHYFMGQVLNDSQIFFWFRISNIVGLIKVPYDYSFTYELTEIVEQKIYDNAV